MPNNYVLELHPSEKYKYSTHTANKKYVKLSKSITLHTNLSPKKFKKNGISLKSLKLPPCIKNHYLEFFKYYGCENTEDLNRPKLPAKKVCPRIKTNNREIKPPHIPYADIPKNYEYLVDGNNNFSDEYNNNCKFDNDNKLKRRSKRISKDWLNDLYNLYNNVAGPDERCINPENKAKKRRKTKIKKSNDNDNENGNKNLNGSGIESRNGSNANKNGNGNGNANGNGNDNGDRNGSVSKNGDDEVDPNKRRTNPNDLMPHTFTFRTFSTVLRKKGEKGQLKRFKSIHWDHRAVLEKPKKKQDRGTVGTIYDMPVLFVEPFDKRVSRTYNPKHPDRARLVRGSHIGKGYVGHYRTLKNKTSLGSNTKLDLFGGKVEKKVGKKKIILK